LDEEEEEEKKSWRHRIAADRKVVRAGRSWCEKKRCKRKKQGW